MVSSTRPRPGSGTEHLFKYWASGEGAAKIRWGVSGDFNRCVRILSEKGVPAHMVKGMCNKLHRRALGGNAPGEGPHSG